MTSCMTNNFSRHVKLKQHQLVQLYITWHKSRDVNRVRYHVMKFISSQKSGKWASVIFEKKNPDAFRNVLERHSFVDDRPRPRTPGRNDLWNWPDVKWTWFCFWIRIDFHFRGFIFIISNHFFWTILQASVFCLLLIFRNFRIFKIFRIFKFFKIFIFLCSLRFILKLFGSV